jgi:hypothetical protein
MRINRTSVVFILQKTRRKLESSTGGLKLRREPHAADQTVIKTEEVRNKNEKNNNALDMNTGTIFKRQLELVESIKKKALDPVRFEEAWSIGLYYGSRVLITSIKQWESVKDWFKNI